MKEVLHAGGSSHVSAHREKGYTAPSQRETRDEETLKKLISVLSPLVDVQGVCENEKREGTSVGQGVPPHSPKQTGVGKEQKNSPSRKKTHERGRGK